MRANIFSAHEGLIKDDAKRIGNGDLAALPPDVRKAFGFPVWIIPFDEAPPPVRRSLEIVNNGSRKGIAFPHIRRQSRNHRYRRLKKLCVTNGAR
jgi:hypothetical protein